MGKKKVVAAGHFCMDMHPDMSDTSNFQEQIVPGNLIEVGGATFCLGGVVGNTGVALYRLEKEVELIGGVGNDLFGKLCLESLEDIDPVLRRGIVVKENTATSYSVVLESPGFDRCFLHCAGANQVLSSADIDLEKVAEANLFHFGYPPLMLSFIRDGGKGLLELYKGIKELGVVTSMICVCRILLLKVARQIGGDIFTKVLPYVDIFLPSLDEVCIMLKREIPRSEVELRCAC